MAVKSLQDLRSSQKEAASTRRSQALWRHAKGAPELKKKRLIFLIFSALAVILLLDGQPGGATFFSLIAGWAGWRIASSAQAAVPQAAATSPVLQGTATRRAQRLVEALAKSDRGKTAEQLSGELKWTLPAVIDGLQASVDAGDVVEDFDTGAGHFVYLHVARTLAGGALDPDRDAVAQSELRRFDEALLASGGEEEAEVAVGRHAAQRRTSTRQPR